MCLLVLDPSSSHCFDDVQSAYIVLIALPVRLYGRRESTSVPFERKITMSPTALIDKMRELKEITEKKSGFSKRLMQTS